MDEIQDQKNGAAFITSKDTLDGVTIQTAEDFLKYAKDCKILLEAISK